MKKRDALNLVTVLTLGLLIMPEYQSFALEAGVAKVEITPEIGTPLNGYGDRHGRGATSVHDPLWVRCIYLNDGDTSIFLISADLCVINSELREKVLDIVPKEVPKENVILTATHTHNGTGAMVHTIPFRQITGRFMPEVLSGTATRFAEAMRKAIDSSRRATIGHAVTSAPNLSHNRSNPDGAVDEQVGVIRIDARDGNPIAVVAAFGVHPTTVPEEDRQAFSADFPGVFCRELEAAFGNSAMAMYLNGASGDVACQSPDGLQGWELTESTGKALSQIVKGIADEIDCSDSDIEFNASIESLPPTFAPAVLPSQTILQTLRLGDLAMSFFPGEPCAALGIRLRERILSKGYASHISVGLVNDHLFYFAPRDQYSDKSYEAAMSFYGPGMEDWFYERFINLHTKPDEEPQDLSPPERSVLIEANGAKAILLTLEGEAHEIGRQKGTVLSKSIQKAYQEKIKSRAEDRTLTLDPEQWNWAPSILNISPLLLQRIALSVRPPLAELTSETVERIEGIAMGAGLPFDAVWLAQYAEALSVATSGEDWNSTSYGTVVGVVGERAGADDLLLARNFDLPVGNLSVVSRVVPVDGHSYLQVGTGSKMGTFTGMNDAGLVICAERLPTAAVPSLEHPPLEIVLTELLRDAGNVETAVERLKTCSYAQGYRVMVAGKTGGDNNTIKVVEFDEEITVRDAVDDLILGIQPATPSSDAEDGSGFSEIEKRYNRAKELLESERILSVDEIKVIMAESGGDTADSPAILNENTRHSVILEPNRGQLQIALPDGKGGLTEFVVVSLEKPKP